MLTIERENEQAIGQQLMNKGMSNGISDRVSD
jgi:hypothetical protein